MPRFLAIEWDSRQARVVIASGKANHLMINDAFSIDLGPKDPGQTFVDPNVGQLLSDELKRRNLGRCKTLLALGRAGIELKPLTLPPAPDEELPEMVRFQAMREFTQLAEDWPLDFIKTNQSHAGGQTNVLAVTISTELLQQILGTCETAGIKPSSLTLRPSAAASLLRRHPTTQKGQVQLLVDLLSEEADMTVMVDDRVVFMRTARLPSSYPVAERTSMLLTEIRRTLAAVLNQLDGHKVGIIYLCGSFDGQSNTELISMMKSEFDLQVEPFDPFAGFNLQQSVSDNMPEHSGRFAPLLGMLLDETEKIPHAIDFLNVKKRTEGSGLRKTLIIAGTLAAVLMIGMLTLHWMKISNLNSAIQAKRQDLESAEQQERQFKLVQAKVREIKTQWANGDITQLNEMFRISRDIPSGEKVIVDSMIADATTRGGKIVFEGRAIKGISSNVMQHVNELESAIRKFGHGLKERSLSEDEKTKSIYKIKYKIDVTLDPEDHLRRTQKVKPTNPHHTKPEKYSADHPSVSPSTKRSGE